jgi:uracil permease
MSFIQFLRGSGGTLDSKFQVLTFRLWIMSFKLYPSAILTMAPIAFVTMTEHFGHVMVLNSLTERDYFKDPGLDRTLTGDGLAQIIAGFFGAPPVTSYGENIGVMALSKVYSVYVIAGAAVIAVLMSFIGKVSALLQFYTNSCIGRNYQLPSLGLSLLAV